MLNNLKQRFIAKLVGVFLLVGLCLSTACPQGQIYRHQECIGCSLIANAVVSPNKVNSCNCVIGFEWSQKQLACIRIADLRDYPQMGEKLEDYEDGSSIEGSPRLLLIACDTIRGFINKNNMCINCRDIVWSSGFAKDQTTCFCQQPYVWNAYYQICGCYYQRTNALYISGSTCNVCNNIGTKATSSACTACNGATFGYTLYGCVNCSSIPYGTGATAGSPYGMCNCQTGYTFNLWLGVCVCSIYNQYALTSANTCQACASLPAASVSPCLSCAYSFFYTGYVCKASSLVGNFSATTNACPPNQVLTSNPITNQTTGCVCSSAAGFYTSASSCLSCTTNPIAGIAALTCTTCSLSAGFFLAAKECIYCPNAPYSTATATLSGCVCQPKYYWSVITSSCVCDWKNNYIGTGACFLCSSLANTIYTASANGCNCILGYAWNGSQCVCDPTSTGVYILSAKCMNCNLMPGAMPALGLGGNSCLCLTGLIWDSTLQQCVCDYTQNFVLVNNFCSDCYALPNTNGGATPFGGCQCATGYIWISATGKCDCPAGYFNTGTYCASCQAVPLPAGSTVAGCQICNVTQGFTSVGGICFSCAGFKYSNGASTAAGCSCTNSSYSFFPTLGCACNFTKGGFVTTPTNGILSCPVCSGLTCSCGYLGTGTIWTNGICTNCVSIAYSLGIVDKGACACLPGYVFTTTVYPFQCYCSFKGGYYMPTSSSCLSCASLPITGTRTSAACSLCSFSQGFLYLSNDTCVLCSSLPNTTGAATAAGCVCSTGVWNNVLYRCVNVTCTAGLIYNSQDMKCVCNPKIAITYGTACILCSSIVNSTGVPSNSTACACSVNFVWTASSTGVGSCVSLLSCNTSTSVLIGTFCLNCSAVRFSTGPIVNTVNCACPSPLVFVFTAATSTGACSCSNALQIPSTTGTSCICNPAFAIASATTTCFDCRTVLYSSNTTSSGACGCLTNFVWNSVSRTCGCLSPFVISGGQCICNATTSVIIGSICFNCLTVKFSSGGIAGTSNCACPAALVWVYTAANNSGVCMCSNLLQIPSTNGSSCICNPAYAIANTATTCFDCRTILYSTNSTVAGGCGCLTNFAWSSTSQSCVCSTPFVLSGGQCICDSKVAVIIGSLCFNCLSVKLSAGPIAGTTNCACPSTLTFVFNNLTNSGTCACTNALQVPSADGSTCLCNPAYAISSTTAVCFDCRTILYFGNSTAGGSCVCLNNFVWSATSLSCSCPSPFMISGGQCVCNPTISIATSGGCFTCSNDPNSTGVSNGVACICNAYKMWNGTACVNICNSTSVYVVSSTNATAYTCVSCGSSGTNTIAVVNAISCSCSGSNLVWNTRGYCDCGATSALVVTGTTYVCILCNSAIYSTGQNTSYSCACPAPLTWNPATQACDCGSAAVVAFINSVCSCVVCNSAIYAASKQSINSCNCISASFVWSSSTYQCACATANSVVFVSGGVYSCNTCNSTIYALSVLSDTTCSCISTLFVWSANVGCICNSSSAVIIGTGATSSCLVCNAAIYAASKNSSTTCNCASAALSWSSTTNQCGCAATNTIISVSSTGVYGCVTCNSSIYAVGVLTSTSCSCVSTAFTWSSSTSQCSCAVINNVVFLSSVGVYSCVTCNAAIYAVASLSPTTCSCINTLFVWLDNVGCVCSNSAAIIIGTGTTATCLTCNATIYASGKSATSNTCICLGSLTWQGTACGCVSPLVIVSGNTCGAATVACSAGLVLLPDGTCVACNSTIFALSYFNATTCNCINANLVWSATAGSCQCSNPQAIVIVVGISYLCLICNSTYYATGRATTRTCTCMGTLTWNSTAQTCGCNLISVIFVGNYSCVTCNSAVYAKSRLNTLACNCIDTTFSWIGNRCACPAGYIIGANFKCFLCPTGVALNNLTCDCSSAATPNSMWNDITKTCVACGTADVPNSIPAFFGVACQCVAGYIWDVMTNACIVKCPSTGCTMTCTKISFTVLTSAPVAVTSVVVKNIIVGSSNLIQSLYIAAQSDYTNLMSLACVCSTGMNWNSLTMRCYSLSFNLI